MPRLGLPGQSKVKPELFLANSGQGCQVPTLAPYSTASLLWVGEGSHFPTLSCPLSPHAVAVHSKVKCDTTLHIKSV